MDNSTTPGGIAVPPNHINININTNNEKQEDFYKNIEILLKNFIGSTTSKNELSQQQLINKMLEKYGELEIGEAIKIAIKKGKNGDIHYLEGILRNRNKPISYNQQESIKEFKQNNQENIILNKLIHKFDGLDKVLEYYYFYNNTYYFKSKKNINTHEIEQYANEVGFKIKILVSNQALNLVKPDIRFMNQI